MGAGELPGVLEGEGGARLSWGSGGEEWLVLEILSGVEFPLLTCCLLLGLSEFCGGLLSFCYNLPPPNPPTRTHACMQQPGLESQL